MTKQMLVTGAGGYIGSVLVGELLDRGFRVKAVDRFFFGLDVFDDVIRRNERLQLVRADTRNLDPADFDGVDVVFDLAGLSNDPASDLDPALTESINYEGSVRVAESAARAGVARLVYASSCSVYGTGASQSVHEGSPLNPVSAYARAKVRVEERLRELASPSFEVVIHRNATVCGLSNRMRFDLVVNLMTLTAWRDGRIFVTGGGAQWRPLVHVRDVVDAFVTSALADAALVSGETFNIGAPDGNYRIAEIARVVQGVASEMGRSVAVDVVPDDSDVRSYNVSFEKIASKLGWRHRFGIGDASREIFDALDRRLVNPDDPRCVTVKYYQYLLECERVVNEVAMRGAVLA